MLSTDYQLNKRGINSSWKTKTENTLTIYRDIAELNKAPLNLPFDYVWEWTKYFKIKVGGKKKNLFIAIKI